MKSRKTAVLVMLAVFYGFSQVLGLGLLQAVTTVQEPASASDFFGALDPGDSAGYSNNLPLGGPADIWSVVAFTPVTLPAGAVVTNFTITFDIQEDIPTNEPFNLNVWALNGPWNESSTRNSISGYSHTPLGAVSGSEGLLANGDNSITFSNSTLTTLYLNGQLANGMFWETNDLRSDFPKEPLIKAEFRAKHGSRPRSELSRGARWLSRRGRPGFPEAF